MENENQEIESPSPKSQISDEIIDSSSEEGAAKEKQNSAEKEMS